MRQTISQLLQSAYRQIDKLDADLLLSFTLGKPREYFIIHEDEFVANISKNKFNKLVKKRQSGIPIAYITGHKEFFGLDFLINKYTLIPRPDTEILVESAIKTINNEQLTNNEYPCHSRESGNPVAIYKQTTKFLDPRFHEDDKLMLIDVGTGTGCIPISVIKHINIKIPILSESRILDSFAVGTSKHKNPDVKSGSRPKRRDIKVFAIDISKKTLELARKNAKKHKVKIKFLHGNLLEPIFKKYELPRFAKAAPGRLFTDYELRNSKIIITANLPYLTEEQYWSEKSIQSEPKSALVAKNEGLALYEKLLSQIKQFLKTYKLKPKSYKLFLEIDPSQSKKITALIKKILPETKVEIKKDLSGKDRTVIITSKVYAK